jgi:hypothetical protein
MKTKLMGSLFVLFALSINTFAQDVNIIQSNSNVEKTQVYVKPKKPHFWIGPKFGSTTVGLFDDFNSLSSQLKEEWQAGLMMQFGRVLYFQPEFYYAQQNFLDANNEVTGSSASIKIPAMMGLRFINLGLFSLHIMGGPQWTIPMDHQGAYDKTTVDWMVGAGIDILGFITADMRARVDNTPLKDQINDFSLSTTPLNLTVGLKLR